ncbi:hypothetical protein tb265_39070 [Gemmatimonadetes bacterium T265]|nr:hypothetical protein tb265_39070 [Gemmatimonadetes bacterium T265]
MDDTFAPHTPEPQFPDLSVRVAIDGVAYVSTAADALTFEQSLAFLAEADAAGLTPERRAEFLAIGDEATRAQVFMTFVYRSGRAFDLLATSLVREGAAWTPAQAAENRGRFATATGARNHQALARALAYALFALFPTTGA